MQFQIFDAGNAFSLMQVEDEDGDFEGWKAVVVKEGGIKASDETRFEELLVAGIMIEHRN